MVKTATINKEFWSDISDFLVIDSRGELKKEINENSVRCSIRNILNTRKGERIFLNLFGSGLDDLIFENIDSNLLNRFSDEIKQSIETWDDRVTITGIDFKANEDNNEVVLTVRFLIKSYNEIMQTTVTLTP